MNILDIFKRKDKSSKNIAKDRLKLVLIHDRANANSKFIEELREEILEVLSKYVEVDEDTLDVKIIQTDEDDDNPGKPALVANIPIKDMKKRG